MGTVTTLHSDPFDLKAIAPEGMTLQCPHSFMSNESNHHVYGLGCSSLKSGMEDSSGGGIP